MIEDLKSYLKLFFTNNDQQFYERRNNKLQERCQMAIEQNGNYIIDYSLFLPSKLSFKSEIT